MLTEEINGKTILITGATGLIGQGLVKRASEYGMNVIASVRHIEKANKLFDSIPNITYVISDIVSIPLQNMKVDYIIHAAANTSSRAFVDEPVEIIKNNVLGMLRVLEFARINPVKSFVFLSTMEIYGIQQSDEKIDEMHDAKLDPMNPRFCYPESKRLCENLCAAYYKKYCIPAKVVRLSQTIGSDVSNNDQRVFTEFAKCAIEGRDIILHTRGETKRSYLSVDDAVNAIFTILCEGISGEAYNAANEETYCSIYEMATMVANKCSKERIEVIVREEDINKYGYAPTLRMNLDTSKLRALGWEPKISLEKMFKTMILEKHETEGR